MAFGGMRGWDFSGGLTFSLGCEAPLHIVVRSFDEPGEGPGIDIARGIIARAEFRLAPKPPEEIKATVAAMQAQRKAAQPTNKRTFGSVFKNPDHELTAGRMLEACGLKGHVIGGAMISPMHANFIENAGGATTADALALMAEARHRARERFGVELRHEVELLGEIDVPG